MKNAEVTIKFIIKDIDDSDLDDGYTLHNKVEEMLEDQGLYTFTEDEEYEILDVEEIKSEVDDDLEGW